MAWGLFLVAAVWVTQTGGEDDKACWYGPLLTFSGSMLLGIGLGELVQRTRLLRQWLRWPREVPRGPWVLDHLWDPAGAHSGTGFGLRSLLVMTAANLLLMGAWAVTIAWRVGLRSRDTWFGLLLSVALTGFAVWHMVKTVRNGIAARRSKGGHLAYDEFPFRLGGVLRARFRAPESVASWHVAEVSLRYVRQERHRIGEDRGKPVYTVVPEILEWHRSTHQRSGSSSTELTLAIPLPDQEIPTEMRGEWRRYWELMVSLQDTQGRVVYETVFFVPIYGPVAEAPVP